MQISLSGRFHGITYSGGNLKTYCMSLHANRAHHTVPSPTTGATRRRNACSVILGKLQILKADDEKHVMSLQLLPGCKHIRWGLGKHAITLHEHITGTSYCAPSNRKVASKYNKLSLKTKRYFQKAHRIKYYFIFYLSYRKKRTGLGG